MHWCNAHKVFIAPSGKRIEVNVTGKAWCLRNTGGALLRQIAESVVCSPTGSRPLRAWRAACLDVPDTGDRDDVVRWLTKCLTMRSHCEVVSRSTNLLAALRLSGVLLWPPAQRWMRQPIGLIPSGTSLRIGKGGRTAFELDLTAGAIPRQARVASALLMACSPMECVEDLPEEAILAVIKAAAAAAAPGRPLSMSTNLLALPRRIEGSRRADGTNILIAEKAERLLRDAGVHRPARSRYGVAAEKPQAAIWVKWFGTMSAGKMLKAGLHQDAAHRRWISFLNSRGAIPDPSAICRDVHIDGPGGFIAWMRALGDGERGYHAMYLRHVRDLFDALCDAKLMARNPIWDSDVPPSPSRNNKTNKADLPRELMEQLDEIVCELIDHAFQQFAALPDKAWVPAGLLPSGTAPNAPNLLPQAFLKPELFRLLGVTLRAPDQSIIRILNPVLPLIVLWLLRVPNRSVEARLADSGEADELLPDLRLETSDDGFERVRATFRQNGHHLRKLQSRKPRRQGVIRLIRDGDREILGLYANVNKSQRGGHKDGADRGREIPWEDPRLHMALYQMRLWQEALNPADRLISRDELREVVMRPSDGLKGKMPGYVFLFRHVQDTDLAGRQEPPSGAQVRKFFMDLQDEAEARLAKRRLRPLPGEVPRTVPKIVLKRNEGGRAIRCAYLLHGLRVKGLNALADAGLSNEVIMEIAGHTNLVMTMYYLRRAPGAVLGALARLRGQMKTGALTHDADEASTWTDAEVARRLVRDGSATPGDGNQIAGFWRPSPDGICPNGATLCHEGGPVIEGTKVHGPVEGGAQNCALCRYFLTGPRFLPGQVSWFNATLYKMKRQAKGLRALWMEQRVPGNEGRRAWNDDRIARCIAEIHLTARSLNARYRRIQKSVELAHLDEAGLARTAGTPAEGDLLLTRMTPDDVAASLRQVSELGFVDEVARVAALIPEAEVPEAQLELGLLVDRMLDDNGFEAIVYRLPAAMAPLAAMAVVDGVRSQAPPGVEPSQFLDDVARGRVTLLDLDMRAIEAELSRAVGRPIVIALSLSRDGARPDLLPAPPGTPEVPS